MSPAGSYPRAVLFDLDDTLFDHGHSSRRALWSVREERPELSRVSWPELRETYARLLEEVHVRLLSGELTLEQSRHERFRRLFSEFSEPGQSPDDDTVREATEAYGRAYRETWQPVSGAGRLLERIGRHARVAVVTNNLLDEQRAKLGPWISRSTWTSWSRQRRLGPPSRTPTYSAWRWSAWGAPPKRRSWSGTPGRATWSAPGPRESGPCG